MSDEHTTFLQDEEANPAPPRKNSHLARNLQTGYVNDDIVKIERYEEGANTGWMITYRS